eukprot:EG_transcript_31469
MSNALWYTMSFTKSCDRTWESCPMQVRPPPLGTLMGHPSRGVPVWGCQEEFSLLVNQTDLPSKWGVATLIPSWKEAKLSQVKWVEPPQPLVPQHLAYNQSNKQSMK